MKERSEARSILRRLVSIGAVDRLAFRDAALRADEAGTSTVLELLKADATDPETLADYLAAWLDLPRLRLSLMSTFKRDSVLGCQLSEEVQQRYLICPLAQLPDESIAVAIVDPLWEQAVEVLRLHCGNMLSLYVIGWSEILLLFDERSRDFADVEDEVTQIEPIDERVLELVRAIQFGVHPDFSGVLGLPEPLAPEGSVDDELPTGEHAAVQAADERSAQWGTYGDAEQFDEGDQELELAAPLRRVTDPSARQPLAEVNLAEQSFDTFPAIQAVFSLVERSIAIADSGEAVWSDIHDCASLLCSATVRGVRRGEHVELMSSRVFGTEPPAIIIEVLASLLRPHLEPVDHPRHDRIALVPHTRLEEDFVTIHGREVVLVRLPDGPQNVMFFAASGLADEFRASFGDHLQQLLTRVEDYEPLLFDDVNSR